MQFLASTDSVLGRSPMLIFTESFYPASGGWNARRKAMQYQSA